MLSVALLLLLAAGSCVNSEQLNQPASLTVQPGQPLTITCQVSYSVSTYATAWVRQPAGKGLEWIGWIYTGGTYYKESLKNKFSISLAASSKTATLTGQNMQPEDSAVYYCARDTQVTVTLLHCDTYFDYWGKGTVVTVSSATPKAPTVFPLEQCGPETGDTVTLGCLATDFTPASLGFRCTNAEGVALPDVLQYPAVEKNRAYFGVSRVRVQRDYWDARKVVNCVVEHSAGQKQCRLQKKVEFHQLPTLNVLISPEMKNERSTSFSCFATDFSPNAHEIKWLRDDEEIRDKISEIQTSFEPKRNENGTLYSVVNYLQVDKSAWTESEAKITCVFKQKEENVNKSVDYNTTPGSTTCNDPCVYVDIEILPLSLEDLFLNKKAKLVCEVLEKQGSVESVEWQDKDGKPLNKDSHKSSRGPHNLYRIEVDVLFEEWSEGMEYYCVVEHNDLIKAVRERFQRDKGETIKRPSVFLLSPVEQTSNDVVILTCYVKDFYPKELVVSWLVDDVAADPATYTFNTTNLLENSGFYSVYSELTLSLDLWKKNDKVFSCVVYHESMMKTTGVIIRSFVQNTNEKPNLVNVSLNIPQICKAELNENVEKRVVHPTVTMSPDWRWVSGAAEVSLVCTYSGYYPDDLEVQWQIDSRAVDIVPVQKKFQAVEKEGKTFSLRSQIELDRKNWTNGSNVTCKSKHHDAELSKSISICAIYPSSPPCIHLETPSFKTVMMAKPEVTATCVVETVYDAKVTWHVDGEEISATRTVPNRTGSKTYFSSNLTVSTDKWMTYSRVTCRAEHPCSPPAEKTVDISKSPVPNDVHVIFDTTELCSNPCVCFKGLTADRAPSVLIRRSLPHLLHGDDAVLECDVRQLSSSDLYVTFQANGSDISEKQFVDLSKATGLTSTTLQFSVPKTHQGKDNTFTCKVNQGFVNSSVSDSTGRIFGDLSMELLLVPSKDSGQQKLLCIGWGFSPQIKWLSGSQDRSASTKDILLGEDGRVAIISHLNVPQNEWTKAVVFTCEVSDKVLNKTVRDEMGFCSVYPSSPPCIHLETPSFKTVMMAKPEVTATCVVETVYDAKVTWHVDGEEISATRIVPNRTGSKTYFSSNLTVSTDKWMTYSRVTCRAEHPCSPPAEKTVDISKSPVPNDVHVIFDTTELCSNPCVCFKGLTADRAPSVLIRRSLPHLLHGEDAVLECDVRQLSSSDLYVTFQANGSDISEKQFVDLSKVTGLTSTTLQFSVPKTHQGKDNTFTCKVNQGFVNSSVSDSTGRIFGDLSMELLLVPSKDSGQQKLLCIGWGFSPQIKWLSGSQDRSASTKDILLGEDGRVAVISHLNVPQNEWTKAVVFTCEVSDKVLNKTVRDEMGFCSVYPSSPPCIHLETPSFKTVMMAKPEVTATCVVETVYDAKVTWHVDGEEISATRTVPNRTGSKTYFSSNLTVSTDKWMTYSRVTCRAEHPCSPPAEKTVDISKSPVPNDVHVIFDTTELCSNPCVCFKGLTADRAPSVLIRRSLPHLLHGEDAVLECDVRQLSSSDLYVTFQANGSDISEKQFVDLSKATGLTSTTLQFSVPKTHQGKDNTFTCKVNQGFVNSSVSDSTGRIFGDLSMELLLVPSKDSGQQKLLCIGWGFSPQIKWLSGSQDRSASTKDILLGEDGRVAVISHLNVPQNEWTKAVVFTCEVSDKVLNKTVRDEMGFCSVYPSSPPCIHLETPSFKTVMMAKPEVTATCVVETVYDAKVTWHVDGEEISATRTVPNRTGSKTYFSSNLTVSTDKWMTYSRVTCRAEHPCSPPAEKTVDISKSPVPNDVHVIFDTTELCSNPCVCFKGLTADRAPSVLIRRSLPHLLHGEDAVLECDVRQLSSSDLYVTFQANGSDISEKQFVDLSKATGLTSTTLQFSVPKTHQGKDNTFTCKVNQGFVNSSVSDSTGRIFGDLSMELLLVPSKDSGQQKLLCIGWGFSPQIKWLSGSQDRSASTKDILLGEDGRVAVISHLNVPQNEWTKAVVFTCEVSDKVLNKTVRDEMGFCSAASSRKAGVFIQGPALQELQTDEQLAFTCLLVGQNLEDFSITWKVGGNKSQRALTEPRLSHDNGTETIRSFLNVSAKAWLTYTQVSCEGKHLCSTQGYETHISRSRDPKPPFVKITRLNDTDLPGSNMETLICLVTGFSPSGILVFWEKDGLRLPVSQYTISPVWKYTDSNTFSLNSRLNISRRSERDQEAAYSCVVKHESYEELFKSTVQPVFAPVTPSPPSVTLLHGPGELVCLANGFRPAPVNISWFLDETTELWSYNTSEPHRGPQGDFSVQSRLRLPPVDWPLGAVYTCRVTHVTLTLALNFTKPKLLDHVYVDQNQHDVVIQDVEEEDWYMAFTFLLLFFISLLYGVTVTLIKSNPLQWRTA
ncbi:uncharacterized protein LOC130113067 [Lampris incognitus]|uniref:uncharacterized protein LOC130113067 n=1 Tax=Lampris incognitus TaxID=2546036 RepID=UPI0024B4B649|nr:uncharacterized protein LOC130113067 [Lampris incognitus]